MTLSISEANAKDMIMMGKNSMTHYSAAKEPLKVIGDCDPKDTGTTVTFKRRQGFLIEARLRNNRIFSFWRLLIHEVVVPPVVPVVPDDPVVPFAPVVSSCL